MWLAVNKLTIWNNLALCNLARNCFFAMTVVVDLKDKTDCRKQFSLKVQASYNTSHIDRLIKLA